MTFARLFILYYLTLHDSGFYMEPLPIIFTNVSDIDCCNLYVLLRCRSINHLNIIVMLFIRFISIFAIDRINFTRE